MATNRFYNLILDGVTLPLRLQILNLTYMGAPVDLPVPKMRSVVNGKVRNIAGYNRRLYVELETNAVQLSQDEILFQVVDDGISFKQDDRVRTLWFPSPVHTKFGYQIGEKTTRNTSSTYFNKGQWQHLSRTASSDRKLILPIGRTSIYFRFDQKWSLQMDAFQPLET